MNAQPRIVTGVFTLCLLATAAGAYGPVVQACAVQECLERVRSAAQQPGDPEEGGQQDDPQAVFIVQPYWALDRNVRVHLPTGLWRLATPVHAAWSCPHHPSRCEAAHDAPSVEAILSADGLLTARAAHAPPHMGA